MRTTIFSTSLFLITSLCLFAQIGSSDERKIDDMGRKLEALKASLLEMQKDSDSTRIINPPARPKRVFEKSEIEISAPKTNNSSINRVFDQVSPSIITESISPEKVDQGFENLNERFSSISKQLNDEDANVSSANTTSIDSDSSTKSDVEEEITDFPVISERKLQAPTSPPPSSLLIRNTKSKNIINEPASPLGKTVTGKVESGFSPSFFEQDYFEYKKRKNSTIESALQSNNAKPAPATSKPKASSKGKTSFNFYYGMVMPQSSEIGIAPINFENGEQISLEYLRDFGFMSIGGSYFYNKFDNKHFSVNNFVIPITGSNSNHGFYISSVIEPKVTESLFLRGKLSGGISFRTNEVIASGMTKRYTASPFKYSLMVGVGYKWSDYFNSMLFYEFDGVTASGDLGGITTHQFGLGLGLDF